MSFNSIINQCIPQFDKHILNGAEILFGFKTSFVENRGAIKSIEERKKEYWNYRNTFLLPLFPEINDGLNNVDKLYTIIDFLIQQILQDIQSEAATEDNNILTLVMNKIILYLCEVYYGRGEGEKQTFDYENPNQAIEKYLDETFNKNCINANKFVLQLKNVLNHNAPFIHYNEKVAREHIILIVKYIILQSIDDSNGVLLFILSKIPTIQQKLEPIFNWINKNIENKTIIEREVKQLFHSYNVLKIITQNPTICRKFYNEDFSSGQGIINLIVLASYCEHFFILRDEQRYIALKVANLIKQINERFSVDNHQ
jgi:hypothetical protein